MDDLKPCPFCGSPARFGECVAGEQELENDGVRVWPAEPHTRGAYPATMMADVRVWPAEPHTRGAYPATTMVDDPAYDTDAALDNR